MSILSNIKNYLKKKLRDKGYKFNKIGPYSIFDFESFLYRHLKTHKKMSFIQIGANDGVMNDPIYKFNFENKDHVNGYVLEPLPDIFEKLKENYKDCKNIVPCNVAIHNTESEMILHRVSPSLENKVPNFAKGIASFDKNHWKKTSLVNDENLMEEINVKCVKFSDFIKSKNIRSLDLLIIDTEGYDYEIIMSIDFEILKPNIIRFEHGLRNNLMTNKKFSKICKYLNSFGYQIITESYDATAYIIDPKVLYI